MLVQDGGLYRWRTTLSSLLKTAMEDSISNRAIKLEFIDLEESVTNRTVHKSDGGPLRLFDLRKLFVLIFQVQAFNFDWNFIFGFFEFWILNFGESRIIKNQPQTNKSEKDENLSNFGSWRTCFWR